MKRESDLAWLIQEELQKMKKRKNPISTEPSANKFECPSEKAFNIKVVYTEKDLDNADNGFNPTFPFQVTNERDVIQGYQDLKIK